MASLSQLPRSATGRPAADVARQVMSAGGEILRRSFRGALEVDRKGRGNFVTDIDVRIEQMAHDLLRREYPSFGFVGEESGSVAGDEPYTWIIDPIDGTANFAGGIPHFATTIALLGGDGVPLLGCTYDPVREDLFLAALGAGATANGRPMRVGALAAIDEGVLGFDLPYPDQLVDRSLELMRVMLPVQRVRLLGSAALGLAYAAAGWFDLHYHLDLRPWDVAAGLLFVREAGGHVVDIDGQEATTASGSFVAGNRLILDEFLQRTAAIRAGSR